MSKSLLKRQMQNRLRRRIGQHVKHDKYRPTELSMHHHLPIQHGTRLKRPQNMTQRILPILGIPPRIRLKRLLRLVTRPIHQHRRLSRKYHEIPHPIRLFAEVVPSMSSVFFSGIAPLDFFDVVPRKIDGHAPDEIPGGFAFPSPGRGQGPASVRGDGRFPGLTVTFHEAPDGAALSDGQFDGIPVWVFAEEIIDFEDVVGGIDLLDHKPQLLREGVGEFACRGVVWGLDEFLGHGLGEFHFDFVAHFLMRLRELLRIVCLR
mmetsp:Transcript_2557/g.5474  ORF Transcript_2557/g.5474 Transcript_2557/m.5474 type:complete len:262 (-) Transcript_2557:1111-1896(-)